MSHIIYKEDVILPFGFQKANVRGKIIKLSNASKIIVDRFSSHNSINKVLLDALSLSSLIASSRVTKKMLD
jgi:redox-regulated HSP33 family molecular chaperone